MLGIFSFASLSPIYLWQVACFDLSLIFIGLFVFLLLSFKDPLSTLDTNSIANVCFQIFFSIMWLAFLLSYKCFSQRSFSSQLRSKFCFFSQKVYLVLYLNWSVSMFSPMLPSRIFFFLHFTLMSVINFFVQVFCKRYNISVYLHCSKCICTVVPGPSVVKSILSPLNCICFLIKDQLIIFVWVCL